MEEEGFQKHLVNTIESLCVDTAIQVESVEIISKAMIKINLGVKEEHTLSHFKIHVVGMVKEWRSALKLTALKYCFDTSFVICV
jgi:hypothetical protein